MDYNYKGSFFGWTVIIGYYAMYHAALAALRLIGLEARRHDCASAALKFFYVERGKLEGEKLAVFEKARKLEERLVETLEKASVERTHVQYGTIEVKARDAEWVLKASREFVAKTEDFVMDAKGIKVTRIT